MPKKRYYTDASGTYYSRCRDAHQESGQRCTICMQKSTNIHHAYYGDDVLGVSIFPICASCHKSVCHSATNWIPSKIKMKARNTYEFTTWLQIQYKYVQTVHNPLHGKLSYRK